MGTRHIFLFLGNIAAHLKIPQIKQKKYPLITDIIRKKKIKIKGGKTMKKKTRKQDLKCNCPKFEE